MGNVGGIEPNLTGGNEWAMAAYNADQNRYGPYPACQIGFNTTYIAHKLSLLRP